MQFRDYGVIAIKVSPHLHEPSEGLILISEYPGYSIYEETNPSTGKDTSRMLNSGAAKVYYIEILDGETLFKAFTGIVSKVPLNIPVICESPSLVNFVEPGVFAIMISDNTINPKDLTEIRKAKHIEMSLEGVTEAEILPFSFYDGVWSFSQI